MGQESRGKIEVKCDVIWVVAGGGETLLARPMPGILPKMSIGELLDVTRIYSVAD